MEETDSGAGGRLGGTGVVLAVSPPGAGKSSPIDEIRTKLKAIVQCTDDDSFFIAYNGWLTEHHLMFTMSKGDRIAVGSAGHVRLLGGGDLRLENADESFEDYGQREFVRGFTRLGRWTLVENQQPAKFETIAIRTKSTLFLIDPDRELMRFVALNERNR